METLFSKEVDLRMKRISKDDVERKTDIIKYFHDSLKWHEDKYPNIEKWNKNRVLPGIINEERVAYVGFDNEEPIVTAVLKRGINAKICHLNIKEKYQDQNIGNLLFAMMALDIKRESVRKYNTKVVHFTLPEGLWESKGEFFRSFGFERKGRYFKNYRASEDEFYCTASFKTVWGAVLEKLPKIMEQFSGNRDSLQNGLIMSINPEYLRKILNGDKFIEIRKRFSKKWIGSRVTLYSTKPSRSIEGSAKIKTVINDTPINIWHKYGNGIGCTKSEFFDYTKSDEVVYAIVLENIERYTSSVYLTQINHLLDEELSSPQSYIGVNANTHWAQAVSIAEIIHKRFKYLAQIA